MNRNHWLLVLAAALLLLSVPIGAAAAGAERESALCFGAEAFSREGMTGICITGLPEGKLGTAALGNRVIRPGDVLTADQAAAMTFLPTDPEQDVRVQVSYLPIFADRVEPEVTETFSFRGREDKPPVAEDSALETYKNLANTGHLKAHDPEGEAMTFAVTRQPRRGTVEIRQDGSFIYTPKNNKVGIDSFTYTATDPAGKTSREATVTITILKPTAAPQYSDTAGRDCRFAAEWMKHTGIFVGEELAGNACFNPDKSVTRGEFLTMLVKALEIPVEEDVTYTGYTDEIPDWLKPYLAAAVRSGLTANLHQQELFYANAPMEANEAAAMLCCGLDLLVETAAGDDGQWSAAAVSSLMEKGIDLGSDNVITRGQAAMILYQADQLRHGTADRTI